MRKAERQKDREGGRLGDPVPIAAFYGQTDGQNLTPRRLPLIAAKITGLRRVSARCWLRLCDGCHTNGQRLPSGYVSRRHELQPKIDPELKARCSCSKSAAKTLAWVEI